MRFTTATLMALSVAGVKIANLDNNASGGDDGMLKAFESIFNAIDTDEDDEMDKPEFEKAMKLFNEWGLID